ncbi:MAG: hypothetical protein HQL06_15365 [Nitrospirae bacterium]|nr:hypothetical protein [Nitrospirota bacterium]
MDISGSNNAGFSGGNGKGRLAMTASEGNEITQCGNSFINTAMAAIPAAITNG